MTSRWRTAPASAVLALAVAGAGAQAQAEAPTSQVASAAPEHQFRGPDLPDPPDESPATLPAWLRDAKVDLRMRSFADHQNIENRIVRHAVVQGLMIGVHTGLTGGPVGVGLDASAFAALRVAASADAGNMGHVAPDGTQGGPAWAYPGLYDLRLESGDLTLLAGTQTFANPFLDAQFNRALPPVFLGTSATWRAAPDLTVQSAYVTRGVPRGRTHPGPLTTSYGGVTVDRFYSLGVVRDEPGAERLSLSVGEAENTWRQFNAGAAAPLARSGDVTFRADANAYLTQAIGARREGPIDNLAWSLALMAVRGESRVAVSYQQVAGRQFFDYLSETSGGTLENAAVVDFNAPHEQSVKLRVTLGPDQLGVRGLKLTAWATTGWGADGRFSARQHADPADPLHALYWRNGQPIAGRHDEVGLYPSYLIADGWLRDARLTFVAVVHRSDRTYSDPAVHEYRAILDVPFH
jgi:hypothetical protein